jgi:hypothetical protein
LQGLIVTLKVLYCRFARVICGVKFHSDDVGLDKFEGVTGGRKLTTEDKQKQRVTWQVSSRRSTGSRLNRRQACRMEAVAGGR